MKSQFIIYTNLQVACESHLKAIETQDRLGEYISLGEIKAYCSVLDNKEINEKSSVFIADFCDWFLKNYTRLKFNENDDDCE